MISVIVVIYPENPAYHVRGISQPIENYYPTSNKFLLKNICTVIDHNNQINQQNHSSDE